MGLTGKTLGRYHLLEQIGQGGMSSVFKALDLQGGGNVAVKILSPYIAHEARFRARFAREVKLLRRLQHPHIVPILDYGESEGFTYIVMPYIGTGTLQDRLQQGPLDVQTGARVTAQVASALSLAHDLGVIHRDVKPSNVLLDQEGNALLSDFSFAHQQDASQNLTGSALIGTPAYMSPEQCRGERIDSRSDQYSFGIMLYQLCTGKLPFEGDTPMAVALMHVNTPLPRPRLANPNLPQQVEAVLVRALAKDQNLRYASMAELNQAFQQAVSEGLETGPRKLRTPLFDRSTQLYEKYQRIPERVPRPWYRRRGVATASVVLLLLLCPLSTWAMSAVLPGFNGASAESTPQVYVWTPTGLGATLLALRTANAPAAGTEMSPDQLNAAVAATVSAMGIVLNSPTSALAVAATPTTYFGPKPTPTPSRTLKPGETPPTSPPTVLSGSLTPMASATPTVASTGGVSTGTAGPSATQPPANTTAPTATRTPTAPPPTNTSAPPTSTPAPPTNTPPAPSAIPKTINPNACKTDPPNHPNYCTPTPGP